MVWGNARQRREEEERLANLNNLTMSTVRSGHELERTVSIDLFRLGQRGNYPDDKKIYDFIKNTLKLTHQDLQRIGHTRSEGVVWLQFKDEEKLSQVERMFDVGVRFPGTVGNMVVARRLDQPTAVLRLDKVPHWVSEEDIRELCSKWGEVKSAERGVSACFGPGFPVWDGTWRIKVKRDWSVPTIPEYVLAEGSHWVLRDEGVKPPMSCNRCGSS